jgi:DNA-binding beta-propeller fold protein YncE
MLNAITTDSNANIYVSDSVNGIIWRTGPLGGVATAWLTDPLLSPSTGGQPPLTPNVGANGLAFSTNSETNVTTLLVANTAFRQIIQIPLTGSNCTGGSPCPGTPITVFATGINGPDGIAVHPTTNNVWIAANMSDEIVVIGSVSGRALAKRGDFDGVVKRAGEGDVPAGLLFPTNLAFTHDGKHVYIANPAFQIPQSIVRQYAAAVTTWTISKMSTEFKTQPLP